MTPLTFSFGAAYVVTALVSAVGEHKLMPLDPDCRGKVVHGTSGHSRDNSSWILGRIIRDFDDWKDNAVEADLQQVLEEKRDKISPEKPAIAGLIVSIYEPSKTITAGTVKRDHVFWIGLPTMLLQLAIAFIALGIYGEWGTLFVTAVGSALAVLTGMLPQWRKEKWTCRRQCKHSYI